MQDTYKTKEQLVGELVALRKSLVEHGRANLLLSENRTMSTKRFASGIAHEINNPLGIISGYAELALLNPALPPTIRGDIQVIHSECNRAARILHDLLGFSGERPLIKLPVDLEQILVQVLKLKYNEFDLYNIVVSTVYAPGIPEILVDGDQLIEVLLNILDNAQQAMTTAHGGGKIRITSRVVEDRIRISINDTGPGITPGDMVKIFNPFFTTKDVGRGAGLGLSISQEIMRQHGGALWAESPPNEGSTFHLELPLGDQPPTNTDVVVEPVRAPAVVSAKVKRIMVVNDE